MFDEAADEHKAEDDGSERRLSIIEEKEAAYAYPHVAKDPKDVWLGFDAARYWAKEDPSCSTPHAQTSLLKTRFKLYQSRFAKVDFGDAAPPPEVNALLWGLAAMDLYAIEQEYAFGLKTSPNAFLASLGDVELNAVRSRYISAYGSGLLCNLPDDSTSLSGLSFLQFCTDLPAAVKSGQVLQAVVALYRRVMAADSSFCWLVDQAMTEAPYRDDPLFKLIQADAQGYDQIPSTEGSAISSAAGAGAGMGGYVSAESRITPYQQAALKRLESIRVVVCAAAQEAVAAGADAQSYSGRLIACLHGLIPVTRAHARDQGTDFTWVETAVASLCSVSEANPSTSIPITPPWSDIEIILRAKEWEGDALLLIVGHPELYAFVGPDIIVRLLEAVLTKASFGQGFALPDTPGIQSLKPTTNLSSPMRGVATPPIPMGVLEVLVALEHHIKQQEISLQLWESLGTDESSRWKQLAQTIFNVLPHDLKVTLTPYQSLFVGLLSGESCAGAVDEEHRQLISASSVVVECVRIRLKNKLFGMNNPDPETEAQCHWLDHLAQWQTGKMQLKPITAAVLRAISGCEIILPKTWLDQIRQNMAIQLGDDDQAMITSPARYMDQLLSMDHVLNTQLLAVLGPGLAGNASLCTAILIGGLRRVIADLKRKLADRPADAPYLSAEDFMPESRFAGTQRVIPAMSPGLDMVLDMATRHLDNRIRSRCLDRFRCAGLAVILPIALLLAIGAGLWAGYEQSLGGDRVVGMPLINFLFALCSPLIGLVLSSAERAAMNLRSFGHLHPLFTGMLSRLGVNFRGLDFGSRLANTLQNRAVLAISFAVAAAFTVILALSVREHFNDAGPEVAEGLGFSSVILSSLLLPIADLIYQRLSVRAGVQRFVETRYQPAPSPVSSLVEHNYPLPGGAGHSVQVGSLGPRNRPLLASSTTEVRVISGWRTASMSMRTAMQLSASDSRIDPRLRADFP